MPERDGRKRVYERIGRNYLRLLSSGVDVLPDDNKALVRSAENESARIYLLDALLHARCKTLEVPEESQA
jgi:hypothetical protein